MGGLGEGEWEEEWGEEDGDEEECFGIFGGIGGFFPSLRSGTGLGGYIERGGIGVEGRNGSMAVLLGLDMDGWIIGYGVNMR